MYNTIDASSGRKNRTVIRLTIILIVVILVNLGFPFMTRQHALAHHSSEHSTLKVATTDLSATKTPKFDDPYLRVLLRLALRRLKEHARRFLPKWLLYQVAQQPFDTLWWLSPLALTAPQ